MALLTVLCVTSTGQLRAAEPSTTPPSGLRQNTPSVHFLTGARVVVAPGRVLEKADIVVRDGVITEVGVDLPVRADARVWSLAGKTVYPGFIDAYSELSAASAAPGGAPYWNTNVVPQTRAERIYQTDKGVNKKLRSQGITARLIVPTGGIIRGTSAVVSTGDESPAQETIRDEVALHLQLTVRRGGGRDNYPNSPMGAVALVRQALHDADWYRKAWSAYSTREGLPRPEQNDALEVLARYVSEGLPVIVDTSNERYFFRADRLGNEFALNVIVRGSGREYRRLDAVRATGRTVIVPVNFPKAPDVRSPDAALSASLEELLEWDLAPENAARLDKAGVRIALTAHGLSDAASFLSNVREAVRRGLSPEAALRALTTTPAAILNIAGRHGTIEAGRSADLVIADGDLFTEKAKVLETWIAGSRYEVETGPLFDLRGTWEAKFKQPDGAEKTATIKLAGEPRKLEGNLESGEIKAKLNRVELSDAQWTFTFDAKDLAGEGTARTVAVVTAAESSEMTALGSIEWPNGSREPFSATRTKAYEPKADKEPSNPADEKPAPRANDNAVAEKTAPVVRPADEPPTEEKETAPTEESKPDALGTAETTSPKEEAEAQVADEKETKKPKEDEKPREALFAVNYPLGAFGVSGPPEQPAVVAFTNATVWTSGPQGRIEGATVLVEAGRIKAVGVDINVPDGATVVDCTGRHISPGLIDCHSHIATDGGVNESAQAITAEVRIGDFIDADDVDIYRQLAGGVTSSNILHGSANPIGGQNQVIKMRWGSLPEEIKFAGAPQGIKFALGENVKQANWGERYTTRYPQSRMGVEQLIRDAFLSAQDYRSAWESWRRTQAGLPPRFDLEQEAIVEILEGKRLIHCHSYRQDEILALIRTCEEFGIRIATLQHILEGYKVAEALAKHGAGGSSFSDWWAYKIEVYDSIPYNGALLHNAGVVVSFNSDDAELARRLNLEAAKAMRYGGVQDIEALKFVTLNPARQLRIDDRVGSIEPGKDADLVVWSVSPLSTYTRCEQTWVDGRKYFDRERDLAHRAEIRDMRAKLVQRILKSGAEMRAPGESRGGEGDLWPREDIFCGHDHQHHHGGHAHAHQGGEE